MPAYKALFSDRDLATLVRQVGCANAMLARSSRERLLELCRPRATQIAWTYAACAADAADMAQEILLHVAGSLSQLREPAAFPRWLTLTS